MSDEIDLTEDQVEEVLKPKRGRPKKEDVLEETVEIVIEEKVEPKVEVKVEEKPKPVVKVDDPCKPCPYSYGSVGCKHGCIHYKR